MNPSRWLLRISPRRAGVLALGALGACITSACTQAPAPPGTETVHIKGTTFHLQAVVDDATRTKGLGGVTHIPPDGGMLFSFPGTRVLTFVMRDCPIPIDVAFLTERGDVLKWHEMVPEAPKGPEEDALAYENRLKRYSSGFPARFAVEVAGGTFRRLGLSEGDHLDFDAQGLKARAQ